MHVPGDSGQPPTPADADVGLAQRPVGLPIVHVFSGQGSQWAGMGRELLAAEPAFRQALTECDAAIAGQAGWSLLQALTGDGTGWLIDVTRAQPALWAMQVALARLWQSWGFGPHAVVGHSMGEIAAACVAGALTVDDGATVILARSRLAATVRGGAMATVRLAQATVEAELARDSAEVWVAAHNSPAACVISGAREAVWSYVSRASARGVDARLVKVDFASHTPHMDVLYQPMIEALAPLRPAPPRIDFISTVDGRPPTGAYHDAAYWADNLRRAVRFAPVIEGLATRPALAFVEVSPHSVLTDAITECLGPRAGAHLVLGSLRRGAAELATLSASASQLRASATADR